MAPATAERKAMTGQTAAFFFNAVTRTSGAPVNLTRIARDARRASTDALARARLRFARAVPRDQQRREYPQPVARKTSGARPRTPRRRAAAKPRRGDAA